MRRTIASLFTLSLLFSFLLAVVIGLMVLFGELSLGLAVVAVFSSTASCYWSVRSSTT